MAGQGAFVKQELNQVLNKVLKKNAFHLPDGLIYLDGNSLGPLPKAVTARVDNLLKEQWGKHLIGGWNLDGWMEQPLTVANRVARLIGAPEASVVLGDTLSIKVHQALSAALTMRPDRKVILSDTGNFPTDLYMAQGLIRQLDKNLELKLVKPDQVAAAIDESIAAVLLTQVDYRSGQMHDMQSITEKAHLSGAVMIWDLAHSAGAVPVDVTASNAEFAVGCTYKYLNGGPGAPAFIYARPDIITGIEPALCGWLGHDAPFDFSLDYRPAMSIERMRVGTPPIIQIAALAEALKLWDDIEMSDLRAASIELTELFIKRVESRCPQLKLASPRDPQQRGSQVSFSFEHGYAAMQALIDHKVVGDFRAPDIMRFGFTPLYIDSNDVEKAVDILAEILEKELWDQAKYHSRSKVT